MRLLSRYILIELIKIFIVASTTMTLMLILIGLVREATEQGLEARQVLHIIPFILPDALRYSIPATTLLTACMVYGRMAGANEIVALKALGIHPLNVLWPLLTFSFVLSVATVWLNDLAVTWGRDGVRRVILESVEEVVYGMLTTQRSYSSPHFTIVVKRVEGRRLVAPTITTRAGTGGKSVTLSAEEAELKSDVAAGTLTIVARNGELEVEGQARISFHNDVMERVIPLDQGGVMNEVSHPAYTAMHRIPHVIADIERRTARRHDQMSAKAALAMTNGQFGELASPEWHNVDALFVEAQMMIARLRTEPHRRWSNGFSCLCFAMVGASLAMRLRNADLLTSFFLCFLPILLVYYPLLAFGVDLAKSGTLPPVAVWTGNVILAAVGIHLFRNVARY